MLPGVDYRYLATSHIANIRVDPLDVKLLTVQVADSVSLCLDFF